MRKKLLSIACFFILTDCVSQQYPFVQYTPKDGLINSRVRKSYQDSRGRIYFLTYSGLSVYDGARFRNYTTQNGLASNLVNDIVETGDDSLLVATNAGGLNRLVNGKMTLLKTDDGFSPTGNNFYKRNKNEIYISSDYGLYVLRDNRCHQLNILPLVRNDITSPYFGGITGVGNYLILTTNELRNFRGLYLYDIKNNKICDQLPDKIIASLRKDQSNRIWLSLADKIYMLDSADLIKGKLSLTIPPSIYRQAGEFPSFNMTFNNTAAWFVYKNTHILRIEKSGSSVLIPLPDQVVNSGVSHILADRENTIWLCNDGAGVFKIVNSPQRIYENPAGQPMQAYAAKAYSFKDTVWYSVTNNKLFRKTSQGLTMFSCNAGISPYVFHQAGEKILAYDARNMYEAVIKEKSGSIDFIKIVSLPDSNAFGKKLKMDKYGNIITIMTTGLVVWKNNKLVYHIPVLPSDIVEGFSFDKNDLLWVVKRYLDTEVYSLHPENMSQYLQLVYRFPKTPGDGSPRCLTIDKTGLVWIGTRGDGLSAYMPDGNKLKKIHHFNTTNGLMDNFITTLACDSLNNIIVGTQTGVDRIVHDTTNSYRVENLTKSSNFFAYINDTWTDMNNQAYALTSTGRLLQISPGRMNEENFVPQLLIEEMRVNAQVSSLNKTSFSYKENNISFFVAAPSFIDEKQIRFSYLLNGSGNDQWSDTTTNSVINLTNLSAGKYLLKIKAFFPSTPYPSAESSFAFSITPPWWQAWWFSTAMGLLAIGILVAGFRFYYRRKLERQAVILEKKRAIEKERTRIATDMHDDLGAGLSRIKFLSETIGLKRQQQLPIEEDISKIREYSHEMIDKMGEIVWALNEKNDSLSDLLSYTRSYAVEYLSQNGIQCIASLPDQLPSSFVSGEFRRNIFLAVKEILHNVVKHSQANAVNMMIKTDTRLTIYIHDDGIGFDKTCIRPYNNGLPNMEKRMKDIGGTITIESSQGTAVSLMVSLPL
jgi:signal transduction histidine kinase/ligand-binding sensor domain-containing protein